MKKNFLATFGLLACSQILLWLVSRDENIASGGEIFLFTLVISLFIGLFHAGFRWARLVAAILLGITALFIISLTVEGLGLGFLAVAFLYVAEVLMLFRQKAIKGSEQSAAGRENSPAVLDEAFIKAKPLVKDGFYAGGEVYTYPLLVKRYQSLLIDFLLLFFVMVVTMVVMGESEARQTVVVSLGIVFLLGYEPLLTTYGATLGQYIIGIRVRDVKKPQDRINLFHAYVRLFVKWLLGWLSFVTIHTNPEHRAIHDLAGSSVVIRIK